MTLAGALALVCLPIRSQSVEAGTPAQAGEVRAWLTRIHGAAAHQNFQGTFVVTSAGAVASARIAHYCDGANQFERSEALDGQARFVYRRNDVVHTVWPATKVVLVEQRSFVLPFPALLQAAPDHIADFYTVWPRGVERVAGRETNVLVVKPRDGLRYGYRLWADQATGILLRADVLGERSEVLETSAFSDVEIGVKPQLQEVLAQMRPPAGYRMIRQTLVPAQLETEGWRLRRPVAGFQLVSCVKRLMNPGSEGGQEGGAPQVLQAIYSDGLTHVSMFIEPFNPRQHTTPVLASVGAMQTLMRQQGDWWVTVLGEVPAATLRQFAMGLERSNR